MVKGKKKPSIASKIQARERGCVYCKENRLPDWMDPEKLKEFLSPRGRIMARSFSGVCVKHQKKLSEAVKRARHLGLLSFVTDEE